MSSWLGSIELANPTVGGCSGIELMRERSLNRAFWFERIAVRVFCLLENICAATEQHAAVA